MPRRRRRFSRLSLFYVVVTLGLMIGGSLWIDHGRDPVVATVTGKTEEIQLNFAPQGAWNRSYAVGVEFMTADNRPGSATIRVPQERFDALSGGDTLSIRYLPAFPLVARAANRSTGMVLREFAARIAADQVLGPLLAWLAGGVVVLWIASRIATAAILLCGVAWIAVAFPLLFPAARPVELPEAESQARVAAISLVDRAPARRRSRRRSPVFSNMRRLDVPYQVVQLSVPVRGRSDSVLAVDAVDSGSTPGLVQGAVLPVRYDPNAPRDARLAQGARTFMTRNRYHFLVPIVGFGVLVTLGASGWRARSLRAQAARAG